MELRRVTHVYQNHHLDSTRWEGFEPRDDDIIVTTSYKSGTTFTQQILLHLLHGDDDPLPGLDTISPWIDARFMPIPIDKLHAGLAAATRRRFVKSHLPFDGLPYYENVTYLVVARDPRDVFMSLLNHYGNYTDLAYASLNGGERVGDPLPRYSDDVKETWRRWISEGWFDWESEGYPFWSNMHHTQSYWDFRHLPNFHFLHYADMRRNLPATVRRIANAIDHGVTEETVERVVAATNFESVKAKAIDEDNEADPAAPQFFANGRSGFFFKGTNGRWKDVLDADDLALYEAAKERVLSPACARWLENGGDVG